MTVTHAVLSRTPLYEGSVRRRDVYLTTQNGDDRHTSVPPAGFEPAIPASEQPQTHALIPRSQWDRQLQGQTQKKGLKSY
jgi:hypothetical protein